jgi:hypothetical protein
MAKRAGRESSEEEVASVRIVQNAGDQIYLLRVRSASRPWSRASRRLAG